MPIYEYRCDECGHELEALQKMADPVLTDCPHCGKSALRKKVSAAAFRLKGSGWYETDFKSENKKNLAKADQEKPTAKQDKAVSTTKDTKTKSDAKAS